LARAAVKCGQRGLDPAEANAFLLQTQVRAQAVVSQIVVQDALLHGQTRQISVRRLLLHTPLGLERQQGGPIHQQGAHMGKMSAQLIQDGKTVGIDITPVKHLTRGQPSGLRQHLEAVPGAEDEQAGRQPRKGQKIDLIFGNEDPRDRRRETNKACSVQGQIGICKRR